MKTLMTDSDMAAIMNGTSPNPDAVLGMHSIPYKQRTVVAVRAFLPGVTEAFVYDVKRGQRYAMTQVHADGMFETVFSRRRNHFAYHVEVVNGDGKLRRLPGAETRSSIIAEHELQQFRTGTHQTIYEHLGSHVKQVNGVDGTLFAVWAPNAEQVCVIGDFNEWQLQRHPMQRRVPYGVWELFVPAVRAGTRYQYSITTASGDVLTKTDPYGFHGELQWNNEMSIVADVDQFAWTDQDWLQRRDNQNPLTRPMSAYEVHLGSWLRAADDENRFLTYRELAETLIPYVKEMGFTHIELLPVAEHPYYPSWGYQVTGYYAPTSRYGSPDDFMFFVDECHRQGIGVLMDWVPAHFPKDAFSLGNFDGTPLYEHKDPRMSEHKDWGTLIFDYGKPEVKNFLLANAMFWCDKYHIDGIRVDAVASMLYLDYSRREGEWLPNKYGGREYIEAIGFLKEFNHVVHQRFRGVMTIAEESTSWLGVTTPAYLGGLDFTFKWNLGWMNDMLHYLSHTPDNRKYVHTMVPFALLYAFHEQFMLELSHDEVVHGKGSLINKMPGNEWEQFANLRILFGFMFGHPGKKLLFMGSEFGQRREWNHDTGLDWQQLEHGPHQGLQAFVRDLNRLYVSEPALYADHVREQGFGWIDYHDFHNSVIVFMRKTQWDDQQPLIFVCNFLPNAHTDYRIGVPQPGHYRELLNSDDAAYGGTNQGNPDGCEADAYSWHRQPYSLTLTLPPLSVLVLKQGPADKTPDMSAEPITTSAEKPQCARAIQSTTGEQKRIAPIIPVAAISYRRAGLERPESFSAAILQRGERVSAVREDDDAVDRISASAYAGPQTSGAGRPQGSKRAILAEDGIIDDEKKSSG